MIYKTAIILLLNFIIYNDEINLSFNVTEGEEETVKKIVKENGDIHFYINNEHFVWNKKSECKMIDEAELKDIQLFDIESFIKKASDRRKEEIKNSKKSGSIKILLNHEVFKRIYLYERSKNETILKYEVIWLEEIE